MILKKNGILIIASMGIFVEALDIAIINLTIPSIQAQFRVTNDTVQWLQTLYVLLYGGFLIIGGKLSDVIGRKKIFIAGAGLFLLTSLGAGFSSSFGMLAFFRAAQGLAAALIMPSALSIVTHTFTEQRERSKAIGIFSSFAAIGSGSGLSAGGLISTYWGWHWVFLINVPVLAIVIGLSWFFLNEDNVPLSKEEQAPTETRRADVISGILLVISLLLLSYGIHQLAEFKTRYLIIIPCLATAVLCMKLLHRRLLKHESPLIDLSIFNSPAIVTANAVFFSLGSFFTGYLFIISLLLQKDMHFSAAKAGLLLVPFSLLSALTAKLLLPPVMKRLQSAQLGILGMLLMSAGGIVLYLAISTSYSLPLVLLSAACVSGLGMTISFTSLSMLSIQKIPAKHYGLASSLASTSYFLGAGIGLSVLTLFMEKENAAVSVNYLSVVILCVYALTGLLGLILFNRKQRI